MRGGERSDSQTQLRAIAGGATAPRPLAPARTPVLSLERERELVARCQAGEREAQDELYRTHRRLVAGNLYRVLDRLLERGLVAETGAVEADADERRRYFRATALGRRVAAAELAMYGMVLKRVPALKEMLSDA